MAVSVLTQTLWTKTAFTLIRTWFHTEEEPLALSAPQISDSTRMGLVAVSALKIVNVATMRLNA
jgi:hypothetical protein